MRVCPLCGSMYSAMCDRCLLDGERVVESAVYPLIGQTIDRYRFVAAIGEGAMGCVYRAMHTVLHRQYAIKVLFRDLATNPTLIERFHREAQAVCTMAHPNIVSVTDFVTTKDGLTFIVMELIEGRTLERAIAEEAPFSPARAASILWQIASGLGEAHRLGFVHRDVKPSNLILHDVDGAESVKILDFGIVGLQGEQRIGRLTAVGHIVGTPAYMAPEQIHTSSVGPAADLYALGVILFEMLMARPPFTGATLAIITTKVLAEEPPVVSSREGLELLVAWLLRKEPSQRPQRAEDVIQALESLKISKHTTVSELEDTTLRPQRLLGFAPVGPTSGTVPPTVVEPLPTPIDPITPIEVGGPSVDFATTPVDPSTPPVDRPRDASENIRDQTTDLDLDTSNVLTDSAPIPAVAGSAGVGVVSPTIAAEDDKTEIKLIHPAPPSLVAGPTTQAERDESLDSSKTEPPRVTSAELSPTLELDVLPSRLLEAVPAISNQLPSATSTDPFYVPPLPRTGTVPVVLGVLLILLVALAIVLLTRAYWPSPM